jgi:hypothetical protein
VGLVAGPVADPRLRLVERERDGDERGAEVVRPDGLADLAPLEKLLTGHPDAAEVRPEMCGQVLHVDRHAVVGEHVVGRLRARLPLLPTGEGLHDVRAQIPVPRVVGLVQVEDDPSPLKVDGAPA